jgi:hypothetical protein
MLDRSTLSTSTAAMFSPTAPDDVLLAVDEIAVIAARVIGAHEIAGVEPALGPGLRRRLVDP